MHNGEKQIESGTKSLKEIAAKLGRAVVATAEYQAFNVAEKRFQNDSQAQELYGKYQEAQQSLQLMWQMRASTTEEMQQLSELRKLVEANETLAVYFSAQEKLIPLLRELNEYISKRLNLDFSGLTRPQRGCCG
jgi:cell fate (sporulation/competence/biofilm development) regulator YlbF (YheA/YmcA/DUF963 family)